jgi:hypothetical protein
MQFAEMERGVEDIERCHNGRGRVGAKLILRLSGLAEAAEQIIGGPPRRHVACFPAFRMPNLGVTSRSMDI